MQIIAWGNIPILNEWRRRYPDRDPVMLHQQFWQRRLVCPGGGEYRWNQKYRVMESSVLGAPIAPSFPMGTPFPFEGIQYVDLGVTIQDGGLRARVEVQQ